MRIIFVWLCIISSLAWFALWNYVNCTGQTFLQLRPVCWRDDVWRCWAGRFLLRCAQDGKIVKIGKNKKNTLFIYFYYFYLFFLLARSVTKTTLHFIINNVRFAQKRRVKQRKRQTYLVFLSLIRNFAPL